MNKISREQIFIKAAKRLRADFDALTSIPHSSLKGHEAEKLMREFLNNHLPKRFAAGSGFILDPRGNISKQTDVVIYDALNCPVYYASDDAAIFPSDNVAAVVEVKSKLDKTSLVEAWDNIQETKRLAKTKHPPTTRLVQTQTYGVIFAFSTDTKLDTLSKHYTSLFQERGLGLHPDLVVILDKGILTLSAKLKGIEGWSPVIWEGEGGVNAEGSHIAISQADYAEFSLDAFLRLLLAHLIFYRDRVDHPGFNWSTFPGGGQQKLTYLTSVTLEKDPTKKENILLKYTEEVKKEFSRETSHEK